MRTIWILSALLMSVSTFAAVPRTPHAQVSPGGICSTQDRDFKEFRYRERIPYCQRQVSSRLKVQLYEYYQIPKKCRSSYTIDHIVPLSLGGNNKPENLWPEHKSIKATRQNLEYELYVALKDGRINQKKAVGVIIQDKFNPRLPRNFRPSPNCPN